MWAVTTRVDEATDPVLFARLVNWQRQHGRHGLPWQGTRDPYRVWLSEIMLQQTQVGTVLDYYPRFLVRFPDVQTLARAEADDVLALWSGLGYYSRARNLHRCAQQVVQQWGGAFPRTSAELATLSGIGRSTAAAVAAFCFGEPVSILDGNVRRVLTRVLAYDGDLSSSRHEQQLWALAQGLLPDQPTPDEMVSYTQGLMDLGATVCTRARPQCAACPWGDTCAAHAQGRETAYPVKTRKLVRRTEAWWWLVLRRPDGACWLQQRPTPGIWAGLHSFPVFDGEAELQSALTGLGGALLEVRGVVRHVLTHRDLVLTPVVAQVPHDAAIAHLGPGRWVHPAEVVAGTVGVGLPTPVRDLLEDLAGQP